MNEQKAHPKRPYRKHTTASCFDRCLVLGDPLGLGELPIPEGAGAVLADVLLHKFAEVGEDHNLGIIPVLSDNVKPRRHHHGQKVGALPTYHQPSTSMRSVSIAVGDTDPTAKSFGQREQVSTSMRSVSIAVGDTDPTASSFGQREQVPTDT